MPRSRQAAPPSGAGALERRYGPLRAWQWAAVAVGGLVLLRRRASPQDAATTDPAGLQPSPSYGTAPGGQLQGDGQVQPDGAASSGSTDSPSRDSSSDRGPVTVTVTNTNTLGGSPPTAAAAAPKATSTAQASAARYLSALRGSSQAAVGSGVNPDQAFLDSAEFKQAQALHNAQLGSVAVGGGVAPRTALPSLQAAKPGTLLPPGSRILL